MNVSRLEERIERAIIDEIQGNNNMVAKEPENYIPIFIENLKKNLKEIILDEICG